jgi:hypothetical protein
MICSLHSLHVTPWLFFLVECCWQGFSNFCFVHPGHGSRGTKFSEKNLLATVNPEIFAALKVGEFACIQLAVDKIPCLLQKLNLMH